MREALVALLNDLDQNDLVIGGVAALLLGKPRLTADVDVVVGVGLEQLPRVLEYDWVRQFAEALEDASLWEDVREMLRLSPRSCSS